MWPVGGRALRWPWKCLQDTSLLPDTRRSTTPCTCRERTLPKAASGARRRRARHPVWREGQTTNVPDRKVFHAKLGKRANEKKTAMTGSVLTLICNHRFLDLELKMMSASSTVLWPELPSGSEATHSGLAVGVRTRPRSARGPSDASPNRQADCLQDRSVLVLCLMSHDFPVTHRMVTWFDLRDWLDILQNEEQYFYLGWMKNKLGIALMHMWWGWYMFSFPWNPPSIPTQACSQDNRMT